MKEASKHFRSLALGSVLMMVLMIASAQATEFTLNAIGYENRVYTNPPPNIPGSTNNPQARAISLYSGGVGRPGLATTPRSGSTYLVQSAFGQPVEAPSNPDFLFGEEISPDVSLQADLSRPPLIDPSGRAIYIADAKHVFAAEPGYVTITWFKNDGAAVAPVRYLIGNTPIQTPPIAVYHTHGPNGVLTNDPPQTRAPVVDLGRIQQVIVHTNAAIPAGFLEVRRIGKMANLYAKEKTGLVLLEYRENGQFIGVETVAVRSDRTPDGPMTKEDIGFALTPFVDTPERDRPRVTQGLDQGNQQTSLVYQHDLRGSAQDGMIFPIRRVSAGATTEIEVYWTKRGFRGVVWPYELHRYTADWPQIPSRYQRYVRGESSLVGPGVIVPAALQAQLMPFQEPGGHALAVANNRFSTLAPGWSLLKYAPSNNVVFQVVKAVDHHNAEVFGSGLAISWDIGREITDPYHQGAVPGYIHTSIGNRYDYQAYDQGITNENGEVLFPPTGQIFSVNEGILEIWWANTNQGVEWPSLVKQYTNSWPNNTNRIIIASLLGTGPIDPITQRNDRIYFQNDSTLPGFNPNDEHALNLSGVVYALRDDLGTPATSKPYVLLKYQEEDAESWRYIVYRVVAEQAPYFFNYSAAAGTEIQAPLPLSILQRCPESYGVRGPYWRDRKLAFHAKSAGNDGGPANIVMRYFYPVQIGFFFPDFRPAAVGTHVPWLDRRVPDQRGTPTDITYVIHWPDVPSLLVAETLVKAKKMLPDIASQTSVEIVYDQGLADNQGPLVQLIDPTREWEVDLASLPDDVATSRQGGRVYFTSLPPHLRERFYYDPTPHKLRFKGVFQAENGIEEPVGYLLLNVISTRDKNVLLGLSQNSAFQTAVNSLANLARQATDVPSNAAIFDSLALTAGFARGNGYVTLAFGNSTNLSAPDEPVRLEVIKVTCPIYRGEIKVIKSGNPFDEKLTLRHSADFAGLAEQYVFEWRTLPPVDGLPPNRPPDQWVVYTPAPATGEGALDITIQGSGLFTLTDNYFICRYRPKNAPVCAPPGNPLGWSDWTEPQLAEGWIKRVLAGINPFEQRIQSYSDTNQANTIVSMISQAGARFIGSAPLSQQAANDFGLIEIYETVLRRGIGLSIEGAPPVNYGPANDALLLAAGRLADLYMLLGNEAYADSADPTIGFGTDDGIYGSQATSIHCFMNQVPSLLDEELALLRGRDHSLLPSVQTHPFYNRLIWNFTGDINGGEVAYALNYNIRNVNGDVAGTIDEADAQRLYPQGHGDAWGHYLMAVKNYYRLLRSANFTWVPRIEAVLVGGVPVSVDFLDERKFAVAAAARARAGAEIVSLTYRGKYVENPTGQWQGYQDANPDRAWGLSEWGMRAGQGALVDWVVGNALLPDEDRNPAHSGIQKVDRTTVLELREIASVFEDIQSRIDMADAGLNPLGLAKNVVPFDIDPTAISANKTHFDQIYERSVRAVNNAITVFDHANNSSQLLRRQADTVSDFQRSVEDRERDFNSRLIEIFGYPYSDDIGPTGTYPTGYDGPDLDHFDYIDVAELAGVLPPLTETRAIMLGTPSVDANGTPTSFLRQVIFHVSTNGFGLVKPANWTGRRRAPGEIQIARSELIQSRVRFERGLREYQNLLEQIEQQKDLVQEQFNLGAEEVRILQGSLAGQTDLNERIKESRRLEIGFRLAAAQAQVAGNALAEAIPLATGLAPDILAPVRSAVRYAGAAQATIKNNLGDRETLDQLQHQQDKEAMQALANIELTSARNDFYVQQSLAQIAQLVRQEVSLRIELYGLREGIAQSIGRYEATLERGVRLLDERLRFRQQTAAQVQAYRYKDMAFRIFRNDALQKYRAQFDLAATYVYLAARAYDYETNLRDGDSRHPGQDFLTDIIRARSLGLIAGGVPQPRGAVGDGGLADAMARMFQNWDLVLRGQLGFNNPQTETGRFSFRSELFRIQAGSSGSATWRETLTRKVVPNLLDLEEFKRYCIPFTPQLSLEPAIVIPFSTTINFGQNFFGWPAGGGDNDYDSTHFATKIRSVGVWFANYNNLLGTGMINTPRVYLIPVGADVMRSPTDFSGEIREWRIVDQALPVPFPVSVSSLANPSWIPGNDTLSEELASIRRYARFRAYHDNGNFDEAQTITDSRLIGRSVWNTRWLLIIPGGTLHSDRSEGIQRFINGTLLPTGRRDGNGVTDIKIFFQTYAYGN